VPSTKLGFAEQLGYARYPGRVLHVGEHAHLLILAAQAVASMSAGGLDLPDELPRHLSLLAWEHIVLTGEYR
jgi:hypothetical protein